MASGAVKEAAKAIDAAFAGPEVVYLLPGKLQRTLEKLLENVHELEDADSQRLHEDLLATYKNHVHDEPAKRAPFLHALRLLRPAIKGGSKLSEWWDVLIGSVVDGVGFKRVEIEDASEFVLGVLAFDANGEDSVWQAAAAASYLQKLLNRYLHHTRLPTAEEDVITTQDEYMASQIEAILVSYGRKRPKELLLALNDLFIQARHRAQALSLLSAFVRRQPPRLYLVLETPLIDSLKKCLMIDKSGTVVELALTVLIMFLPHITSALFACLPKLFLIYTRVLCWDQVIAPAPEYPANLDGEAVDGDATDEDDDESHDPTWDKLDVTYGNPNDNPETAAPGALYFFTFLYGLFPLNFMSYVRAPRKWLKSINYLEADDLILDKDALRKRTEAFRQVHLLHPHFFTSTPEEELSETRFLKSEPADVVIDCMGLCMAVSSSLEDPGPPPTTKLPEVPQTLVPTDSIPGLPMDDDVTLANSASSPTGTRSNGTWRNTQSTAFTNDSCGTHHTPHLPDSFSYPDSVQGAGKPVDSPTLPAAEGRSTAEEAVQSDEGAHDPDTENAPTSTRLESFAQALSTNPNSISPAHDRLAQNIATLQREVMLLRNDLNFERYLKSQHLSHIGHLQQKHIKEATFEAETQNLINTNRILKAKLQKANEVNAQLKKEATTTRNQHKKWEGEVKSRITSFQKDSTTWNSSEASLRENLEAAKKDIATLKKKVAETEAKELNARIHLGQKEAEIEEVDILRKEVDDLQRRLREFELKELNFEQMQEDSELLRGELKLANERLRSRDYERERLAKSYERKFAELEALSGAFSKSANDEVPESVQQMIDSALAASNSKFVQLRKTHNRLLHRFTGLEVHSQALEAELAYLRGRQNGNGHSHDDDPPSPSGNDSAPGLLKIRSNSLAGGHSLSSSRGGGSSFATRFGHRHFNESLRSDDEFMEDEQSEFNDQASSFSGPSFKTYNGRPERSESLPARGFHHDPDLISPTTVKESPWSENHQSKSYSFNQTEPLGQSDERSTFSGESATASGSELNRDKSNPRVNPKSETRVYGRGGAQNIGVKKKDDKPKSSGGGFRGFKGLMSHNS
ncbi:Hamartin protein-domain-containing protein [Phyllosticta paracitricarpa]|uniref:Hamartin protein-domain-containing protein n=2 Tax=Phyllosticta TaxID=121621 RepID=A0ABR1LSR0_9PEZI